MPENQNERGVIDLRAFIEVAQRAFDRAPCEEPLSVVRRVIDDAPYVVLSTDSISLVLQDDIAAIVAERIARYLSPAPSSDDLVERLEAMAAHPDARGLIFTNWYWSAEGIAEPAALCDILRLAIARIAALEAEVKSPLDRDIDGWLSVHEQQVREWPDESGRLKRSANAIRDAAAAIQSFRRDYNKLSADLAALTSRKGLDKATLLLRKAREAKNGTALAADNGDDLSGFVLDHHDYLAMHVILNDPEIEAARLVNDKGGSDG